MSNRTSISFEFFPPKNETGRENLWQAIDVLKLLKPSFMTVTYGAGGSTRTWTVETAAAIQRRTGIPGAAHLTCVNTMKDGIAGIAHQLWDSGVRHIVALRGDIPDIDAPLNYNDHSYYHYASELVAGLKTLHDFEISVAAYPEKHPDAPSLDEDLRRLKQKCEAGADRAITQFFFDNDVFYRFRDKAAALGIQTPIVPGLLPVHDFNRMCRVAAACQASVPDWLGSKFSGPSENTEETGKIGLDLLIAQIEDLIRNGVAHLHFYTLNRAELVADACQACKLGV